MAVVYGDFLEQEPRRGMSSREHLPSPAGSPGFGWGTGTVPSVPRDCEQAPGSPLTQQPLMGHKWMIKVKSSPPSQAFPVP